MIVSLRRRFFLCTSAVLILVLLASFWLLESRYRDDLYGASQERLRLHVFTLLSVAQLDEGGLLMPDISYKPKLNTLNSGLWAMVLNGDHQPIWHSLSMENPAQGLTLSDAAGQWHVSEFPQSLSSFLVVAYKIDTAVDQGLFFQGDENELMELLGNLLDNAHKHANSQVNIRAHSDKRQLEICIEDDGPGIAEEAYKEIFKRGIRLDSRANGQGIGLAVVTDIVTQYQGQIQASPSPLGGALFTLQFPNKRS